ncbi:MAG: hypothetical protein PHQ18_04530 [Patescibacteria group bacterium]|nr:hypothetical protein [Patescibacteria group bacterium]
MDLKEKMERYNKRWNIILDESSEESFNKFKTRILNIFNDIDHNVSVNSITTFCQYLGIQEKRYVNNFSGNSRSTHIIDKLSNESNEEEFYRIIEIIFCLDIIETSNYPFGLSYSKNILLRKVIEAINFSNVNVSITEDNGEIILYPKGEDLLDKELVNEPLSFFEGSVNEHFVDALKSYQAKKHIKSAESLRRCLEEFLKYELQNDKGFKANILEIQKKIKLDGRDAQVRNIIGTILNYLDDYFNENSKHNDGNIDDSENEFLIYQVGLLARYINKNL